MSIETSIYKQAKETAAMWQQSIDRNRVKSEKKFHAMMKRMLKDPLNKVFLIELLDQSFRSNDTKRAADQLEYLFNKYANQDLFSRFEHLLIYLFRHMGISVPAISVPLFIHYLRYDVSKVIIKGEALALHRHLRSRRKEQTRVNINIIGESVLGEGEAALRVGKYIEALETKAIDYISIKISTIFSQINPLGHEWSVEQISQRMEKIYDAAKKNTFIDFNGETSYKFVNMDMEEYRDLSLTVDAFMNTLSKQHYHDLYAGIVLQAYLPDALSYAKRLSAWAKKRVESGGAPIKIRLVKGANQEMELTEASLRGWPCVTYLTKSQTDANYKILMDYLLDPAVAPYVHTGMASHNLFDHALGMLLARQRGVQAYYSAEMLEGMSETAYRVLKREGLNVILYAPTATLKTFTNAIAYLVRRFDENTASGNFLRHSFGLKVGSQAWNTVQQSFWDAVDVMADLRTDPFRKQDRNSPPKKVEWDAKSYRFQNESDTDFALAHNVLWAQNIRDKWKNIGEIGGYHASAVIGAKHVMDGKSIEVMDKSQYHDKRSVGSYSVANQAQLEEAVAIADADVDGWRALSWEERQKILMDVAYEFQKSRADLIGVAAAEMGKVFSETDVEVSEAIDFLRFYPYSVRQFEALEGISMQGKGVGLVISPWNFPIAIPTGGVAAALASGNTVILKPSSDAVLSAYRLCQCFWDAGVSQNTLQFVPTSVALASRHLIGNPLIDFVIFTGGEHTALDILSIRPNLHLSAETGGKDATIVTALADRDQAVKNVVASAFNNSGQKCSATSLLVLEKELYEDEAFKQMLVDAASSLEVGSVWEFQNKIGALVHPPKGNLKHALDHLDEDEYWALQPLLANNDNPFMLKPSIRWGTKSGDFCHMHELFGPVLSVMCADDLEDAIAKVNATGYGLTSGLESLDEREQKLWKAKLKAGNLYINRMTTGAIVQRQPFGGMGKSSIGSGKKAGGYNYITQFMHLSATGHSKTEICNHPYLNTIKALFKDAGEYKEIIEKVIVSMGGFAYWLEKEFLVEHDYVKVRGEHNIIRYLPIERLLLRFEEGDELYEIIASIAAAKMSGVSLLLSLPEHPHSQALLWLAEKADILLNHDDTLLLESEAALIQAIGEVDSMRILRATSISMPLYEAAAKIGFHIRSDAFVDHGRIELMHYFIEQSISHSYHRYGNLGQDGLKTKDS